MPLMTTEMRVLHLRIPADLHRRARHAAIDQNVPFGRFIVDALEQAVGYTPANAFAVKTPNAGQVTLPGDTARPEGHSSTCDETGPATPKQRRLRSR